MRSCTHTPSILILFSSVLLWGCQQQIDTEEPLNLPANSEAALDTLRYLALGDSYTIGESVQPDERWPNQLASTLNALDSTLHLPPPIIIAQTGWTTQDLLNALSQPEHTDVEADLVSLLIGVNNQYQGLDTAEYREQLISLIDYGLNLVEQDASKMFIVSIPDYGYTPFGLSNQAEISAELTTFNQICLEEATAAGIAHFNITPISQQWPETPGLVAADGLHPSGIQYGLWVDSFAEELIQMLRSE